MKIVIFPWAKTMRNEKPHPKNFPHWPELIEILKQDGHELIQSGALGEPPLVDDVRQGLSIAELTELMLSADTWISGDSFGQHLGWSIGKPGIVIFGQSDPVIFGHPENINLLKDRSYLRDRQFWLWEQAEYRDDCWVTVEQVYQALKDNFYSKEQ